MARPRGGRVAGGGPRHIAARAWRRRASRSRSTTPEREQRIAALGVRPAVARAPRHARLGRRRAGTSRSCAASSRHRRTAARRRRRSTPMRRRSPHMVNDFLPGLDGATALRAAARAPARAVPGDRLRQLDEVRRPRPRDGGLATHLTSIDPAPRAEIDTLCDTVIRAPLESVDLGGSAACAAATWLFFDGSHRVFMNSDTVGSSSRCCRCCRRACSSASTTSACPTTTRRSSRTAGTRSSTSSACWLLAGSPRVQPVFAAAYVSRYTSIGALAGPAVDDTRLRDGRAPRGRVLVRDRGRRAGGPVGSVRERAAALVRRATRRP